MRHDGYDDGYIHDILTSCKVFAVVGASANPARPSFGVQRFLLDRGYTVIPVNPGQAGRDILGQRVYASLRDILPPVDVVDIFRRSEAVPPIVAEAIAIGAGVVWMQLGVYHEEAARTAEAAGLRVVMNRCPAIETRRLGNSAPRE